MFAAKGGKISVGSLKKFVESTYDNSITEYKGYMLDRNLSTDHTKVFYNHKQKVLLVSERPTTDKKDILSDVIAGLDITGKVFKKIDSRYKKSFSIFKRALDKYDKRSSSILVGYSLGAIVAEEFMRENPDSFDEVFLISKPVLPNQLVRGLKPLENVTEVRSTLDPVSVLKPLQKKADRELVIKAKTINPIKEHQVSQILPRVDQDMEIGDENVLSGAGLLRLLAQYEIKGMKDKDLKEEIKGIKKLVPKEEKQKYNVTGKTRKELIKMIESFEPVLLSEDEIRQMKNAELKQFIKERKKYIPKKTRPLYKVSNKVRSELEDMVHTLEPVLLSQDEMRKMKNAELKQFIKEKKKYVPKDQQHLLNVSGKTRAELKEIIQKL